MLGWLIAGVLKGQEDKDLQTFCHSSIEENLCDIVNKFWQVENCETQESLTEEERYVEEFFENNYSRDTESRFIVKLPVNQEVINQLGNTRDIAMKRLLSVERKFKKDPELKIEYIKFMNKYLQLEHMQPVTDLCDTMRVFYLTRL